MSCRCVSRDAPASFLSGRSREARRNGWAPREQGGTAFEALRDLREDDDLQKGLGAELERGPALFRTLSPGA